MIAGNHVSLVFHSLSTACTGKPSPAAHLLQRLGQLVVGGLQLSRTRLILGNRGLEGLQLQVAVAMAVCEERGHQKDTKQSPPASCKPQTPHKMCSRKA